MKVANLKLPYQPHSQISNSSAVGFTKQQRVRMRGNLIFKTTQEAEKPEKEAYYSGSPLVIKKYGMLSASLLR